MSCPSCECKTCVLERAAPDMLAALKLVATPGKGLTPGELVALATKSKEAVQAAIAKAEGTPPTP